ncbi:MAG: hypothetical protein ACO2PP_18220 [Thermocrinis sp.]|jgi:hypothetical protein|uniref:hypothetical protein n=1 Tax=Thermocrinis sp. TaxID=2024383 RepID=UPI003C03C3AF
MRVLVFTLLFVLGLFVYFQEIFEGLIKDTLKGYIAEIPFGKGANFLVIRGKVRMSAFP